jgi:hypothetical protein
MEIEALPRSPGGEKRSMPMVSDLLETCIDDVIRTPAVSIVTATEEAGPSGAQSSSSIATDEGLCLTDAAARLKQLELEASSLAASPRPNINVNMVLNNQVTV